MHQILPKAVIRFSSFAALGILLALGACSATEGEQCQEAQEHLVECLGAAPEGAITCEPADAEQILSLSCDELKLKLTNRKGDFWDEGLAGIGCTFGLYHLCEQPECVATEDEPEVAELNTELPEDASDCAKAAIEYEGCGACEYYECREASAQCGPDGYLLNFAYRYCERYRLVSEPQASAAGQAWLKRVRRCLITSLDAANQGDSCEDISTDGFGSHSECYAATGFCDLPITDWALVMNTIDPQDLQIKEMMATSHSCVKEWLSF